MKKKLFARGRFELGDFKRQIYFTKYDCDLNAPCWFLFFVSTKFGEIAHFPSLITLKNCQFVMEKESERASKRLKAIERF